MKVTYDKQLANTDSVKVIPMERIMYHSKYDKIEIDRPDMKISMEFPQKTDREAEIVKDVKAILNGELRERLRKNA